MGEDQVTECFFIRSKVTVNPFTWLDKYERRCWADLVLIRQFFRFIHIDTDEKYGGKFFRQSIKLWCDPLTWSTPWGMKVQDKKNIWGAGHQIIQLFHLGQRFQWHLFLSNDQTFDTRKNQKRQFWNGPKLASIGLKLIEDCPSSEGNECSLKNKDWLTFWTNKISWEFNICLCLECYEKVTNKVTMVTNKVTMVTNNYLHANGEESHHSSRTLAV